MRGTQWCRGDAIDGPSRSFVRGRGRTDVLSVRGEDATFIRGCVNGRRSMQVCVIDNVQYAQHKKISYVPFRSTTKATCSAIRCCDPYDAAAPQGRVGPRHQNPSTQDHTAHLTEPPRIAASEAKTKAAGCGVLKCPRDKSSGASRRPSRSSACAMG